MGSYLICSRYRFGFCVSAEPAAVRAALLEPALLRALDAAVAARLEVVFVVERCDSAEPAADLADLLDPLSRSTFDAADAARLLVTSDLAIFVLHLLSKFVGYVIRRWFVQYENGNDDQQSGKDDRADNTAKNVHSQLRNPPP